MLIGSVKAFYLTVTEHITSSNTARDNCRDYISCLRVQNLDASRLNRSAYLHGSAFPPAPQWYVKLLVVVAETSSDRSGWYEGIHMLRSSERVASLLAIQSAVVPISKSAPSTHARPHVLMISRLLVVLCHPGSLHLKTAPSLPCLRASFYPIWT